ncbi:MAG TPA: DUF4864 domain-containing protein [Gemmatimonadaceae bacterium]|nr:DUF4864 domain-containing protein [Gemmatimonadaceae bacterium]
MHRTTPDRACSARARHVATTAGALLALLAAPAVRGQSVTSAAAATSPSSGTAPASATRPKPSPTLAPERVVAIQLDALQHNDTPSADFGIATAFQFASPANRVATGPLDRFAGLVKTPAYRAMINFARAEFAPMRVDGDRARQRVTVFSAAGRRVSYVFLLSRQQGGEFDGCWMTDGVTRVDADAPLPHGMRAV